MIIQIEEIRKKLRKIILAKANISDSDVNIIIDHYLTAELAGIKTHGILKLLWDVNFFPKAVGANPEILKQDGGTLYANMNGMIGALGIDWLISKINTRDSIRAIHYQNLLPSGALFSIAYKLITTTKLSAVLFNNTDKLMCMEGGHDIIGTNPFCIAFSSTPPVILDMATSKKNMSHVFQLKESLNTTYDSLPNETYLDEKHHFTQDPTKAKFVSPYGEYKGYGLGFMIEILSRFMFPHKKPSHFQKTFLCNGMILAFNSSQYDKSNFKEYLSKLADRYPGKKSVENLIENLSKGIIDVDETTLKKLELNES